MKCYCLDTSGISNPLEQMPDDIYPSMWNRVNDCIMAGKFAVTEEIYSEMVNIGGIVGECIRKSKELMVLEVATGTWDWPSYGYHMGELTRLHHDFISEYNGRTRRTVCLNDISIIALSKALELPVVSMESSATTSPKSRRIPDVCRIEMVEHLTFNDFLRREKIRS